MGVAVTVAAAWLIIRSRVLVRVEAGVERNKPRPVVLSLVIAAVYVIADFILELPWDVYADWWREKGYGLTSQPLSGWFTDRLIALGVTVVASALFVAALYAVIRTPADLVDLGQRDRRDVHGRGDDPGADLHRAPVQHLQIGAARADARRGGRLGPAGRRALRQDLHLQRLQTVHRYTANVAGLFGSARVAMSDVMFKKGADIAEVRGVVGHEMGHYKRVHILWQTLADSLLAIVAFGLIQLCYPAAAQAMGAKVGGVDDPVGLPVVMAILATLSLLATPINNTIIRLQEADADAFSLRTANAPDGLSKALVKTIEYRASSPSALEEFLFYDHPSVEHRVRKAMEWKAARPGP